jgi:hypothetical protein
MKTSAPAPESASGPGRSVSGGRVRRRLVEFIGVVIVVFGLPPVATSVAAAPLPKPTLALSTSSGSIGTRVRVTGRNCTQPSGQGDTLAWHDHYGLLHDLEHKPPLDQWRRITVRRASATTVHALYVVLRSDHPGQGLLDLFCGGSTGNATATFTVTR